MRRFNEDGLAGLDDRLRSGRSRSDSEALRGGVPDWNAQPRPYRWNKRPQQPVVPDQPAIG